LYKLNFLTNVWTVVVAWLIQGGGGGARK